MGYEDEFDELDEDIDHDAPRPTSDEYKQKPGKKQPQPQVVVLPRVISKEDMLNAIYDDIQKIKKALERRQQ